MTKKPVIPPAQQSYVNDWHFSPGVIANGFLFASGVTGTDRQTGAVPVSFEQQVRNAIETVHEVLAEAGLRFEHIVDLTTCLVRLTEHRETFRALKNEYLCAPYPAWTAIGVTELATPGTQIELKVIATTEGR